MRPVEADRDRVARGGIAMSRLQFDAFRGLPLSERTRRETLRLLSGAGIGLGGVLSHVGADGEAAPATKRKRAKQTGKKKVKGDARCNCREVLSMHGTCIDVTNPITAFSAKCFDNCFCIAENPGGPRSCVEVTCETPCATDDDCTGDAFCGNTAGCCLDHPEYERTCVTPCPGA
ncbi:MAG TPA: hypothetical protein VFX03_06425 [Thermomicrobiales bacterium]|nr:hypothetical protein [Thermomicrobiales bacterium]